jgi:hypothetical protein
METSEHDTSTTSNQPSLPQMQSAGVNTSPSSGVEALADVLDLQSRPMETASTGIAKASALRGDRKAGSSERDCMIERLRTADLCMNATESPRGGSARQHNESWDLCG